MTRYARCERTNSYKRLHQATYWARQQTARILYRQHWRDHLGPFPLLALPTELQSRVYDFLLPETASSANSIFYAIDNQKVVQETDALPGARPILHPDSEWDCNDEHYWTLAQTCKVMREEVRKKFYNKPTHEVTISETGSYWLGAPIQDANLLSSLRESLISNFSMIRRLRVTVYADTCPGNLRDVGTNLKTAVEWIKHIEDLRQLDIVYMPMPFDDVGPSSVPLEIFDKCKSSEVCFNTRPRHSESPL